MRKSNYYAQFAEGDKDFLDSLKKSITTVAGKEFIAKIEYKMHYEPAMANDLLLSEFDNEEGVYLVRCYDHEFIVGRHLGDKYEDEFYAMSFSEAMNANLKDCHFTSDDTTLINWLVNRDFKGLRYNHNYDLM